MAGFAVRFEGGPFDGMTTMLKPGTPDPPERIRAFRSMMFDGLILFDDKLDQVLAGDAIYKQASKSALPPEAGEHPNVARGAVYVPDEEKGNDDASSD